MESSQASGPAFPPPRRVFTAPTYSSAPQSSSSSQSNSGVVETLYDHPSVKIITFTASSRHYSLGGTGLSQGPDVAPGSLSWSSQLERTIAVGQFRIYRAPGSVAFLNCGSALQPILPKSQVWCVDEVSSKFILQIRRPQYWRIEVPVANEEDIQRALLLRQVFDQILQFEKTECPFKRSFTVELPELPQTPVKKRPWTPAQRPYPALPPTPDHTPVELARVRRDLPKFGPIVISETQEILSDPGKSLDQIEESQMSPKTIPSLTKTSTREGDPEENSDEALQPGEAAEESQPVPEALKLGTTFPALRSVTAPPQLMLHASPPSKVREQEGQIERPRNASSSPSPADSQSSFHSVTSWNASSLPPSPPLSNPASPLGVSCPSKVDGEPLGQEDSPELASISNSSPTWSACPSSDCDSSLTAPSSINETVETSSASSETVVEENTPQTPHRTKEKLVETSTPAVSDSPLSETTSEVTRRRPSIRRRGTTSSSISASRRALSPLPSAANLFAPRRPLTRSPTKGKLDVVRRLPLAIIQTTCEILMSPPSHLINLMLKVAARIAAGEWRGFVFGTDEQGERIPVHWDWSDDEDAESPSPYPALRKNSLGWLPLTGQIMAGTFPESDDEDNDHHEKEIKITQTTSNKLVTSTEIDRIGDHLHEPPSPTAPLDTVRSEDLSESLGVD